MRLILVAIVGLVGINTNAQGEEAPAYRLQLIYRGHDADVLAFNVACDKGQIVQMDPTNVKIRRDEGESWSWIDEVKGELICHIPNRTASRVRLESVERYHEKVLIKSESAVRGEINGMKFTSNLDWNSVISGRAKEAQEIAQILDRNSDPVKKFYLILKANR